MNDFRHFKFGAPSHVYKYRVDFVVARYETAEGKQIAPWSLIEGRWTMKSASVPRPLYGGGDDLFEHPDAAIIVVEGEKCVDHLRQLGSKRIPITWPGGASGAKHADWSSLAGRDVLLFPDHDAPGYSAMATIAQQINGHAKKLQVIDHRALDLPKGWDVADTTWTLAELTKWATPLLKPGDAFADVVSAEPKRVRKGRPRHKPDGSPPDGVEQLEHAPPATVGAMPSAFVSWERLGLDCNQNGSPYPHLANAQRVLAGHPELAGQIWFDEFHGKIFQTLFQEGAAEWLDFHDTRMTIWLQSQLRLHKIGHQIVQRAVDAFARLNTRNEVREWMDSLTWDGTERLATLMADGFGAEQNDYTGAVGRCWMVSMVARTYEPGCKVDTMPVFEGPQGMRKSSALSVIGGKWFAEMHEDITGKDFLQSLPGKLLIEISELHAFRRAEVNRIKGIISCANDRYRESYGRRSGDHPRRGVFAGSVNRDDWVEDDTGARRFWPIACGAVNTEYLRSSREQLFAEARALYEKVPRGTSALDRVAAGAAWWDIDERMAKEEQDQRREADEWTDAVLQYASQYPEVRVADVFAAVLSIPLAERDKASQMRISSIFRVAGYTRRTAWRDGRMVKIWLTIKK
jgi:putative DNA primase/helicase